MSTNIERPFSDVRLRPGEEPSPQRLAEIFDAIQGNFDGLFAKFPVQRSDLGGSFLRSVVFGSHAAAWGTTSVSFSAGTKSTTAEVTHGLGILPAGVWPAPKAAAGNFPTFNTSAYSASIFKVQAQLPEAATGVLEIFWLAIG